MLSGALAKICVQELICKVKMSVVFLVTYTNKKTLVNEKRKVHEKYCNRKFNEENC